MVPSPTYVKYLTDVINPNIAGHRKENTVQGIFYKAFLINYGYGHVWLHKSVGYQQFIMYEKLLQSRFVAWFANFSRIRCRCKTCIESNFQFVYFLIHYELYQLIYQITQKSMGRVYIFIFFQDIF